MLEAQEQQRLIAGLNRVEGQIRGIRRMVEEPRLCIDILQQLAAAEAALARLSTAVFKYHVDNCVVNGLNRGGQDQATQLGELVQIFDRIAR